MSNEFKVKSSKFKVWRSQGGQALVTLLFFMVIALTITTTAILVMAINSLTASKLEQGSTAYSVAESGIENALLRLLRNPNYTGETLVVGSGSAQIVVTGTTTKTITSTGTSGNFVRKIQVLVGYTNNILSITSWKETY